MLTRLGVGGVTAIALATAAPLRAADLPPGPGQDIVNRACTGCHDSSMFTSQRKDAAGWTDTVNAMIANGAPVPPASVPTVVAYLVQNFGAPAAAAGAAPPRSKNLPPVYVPIPWQRTPGKPIDQRTPERQDNAADFPGQYRAPYMTANVQYKTEVITNKLVRPWALQFLPSGKFLITQRMGQMVIVDNQGKITELKGIPEVAWEGGQGGLLDVALDPDFRTNHRIYFAFNEPTGPKEGVGRDGAQSRIAVGRAVLDEAGAALNDLKIIFRSKPTVSITLYPTKQGSRIVFDKAGLMYVSIGNRDSTRLQPPPWNVAQDMQTHLGKIIRITTDGQAAPGNPFIGVPDALPEIWALGTRSQEGLAFDSSGRLWETEHGPRGGDELNIISKGKNYGWPLVTHGIDYPGWMVTTATHKTGLEDPRYFWDPNIAPSGLTFYYADLFPAWKGSLFVGGLHGGLLDRLTIAGDKVVGEEPLLTELNSRIRDVRVGPEGGLYVLTDDTNMLVKVTPK
ncbi:PQQ-dependent sugar dehydrogenase [Sphingomonas quercus]|nr:PQQ-dependent sugar dehydrogenase [Sphingomonas quercus]